MEDDTELFEPGQGLNLLEEAAERFGGDPKCFYFLFRSLGALPVFIAPLEIKTAENGGCVVTAYGKRAVYEIHLREKAGDSFVSLTTTALSDKRAERVERTSWNADDPSSWMCSHERRESRGHHVAF